MNEFTNRKTCPRTVQENSEINDEMSGVEVIDLHRETQTKNSEFHDRKESTKQESQDKMKSKTICKDGEQK